MVMVMKVRYSVLEFVYTQIEALSLCMDVHVQNLCYGAANVPDNII